MRITLVANKMKMRPTRAILYFVSILFFSCKACSFFKEQEDAMFDAIIERRADDLGKMLIDYQGDINAKPFSIDYNGREIMTSLLGLASACGFPEIMRLIIKEKQPIIKYDTFDPVFKSNCDECFDVLLDNSDFYYAFNRNLFHKISYSSVDYNQFITFVSKLSKRLDLNDQLALIENAFTYCTDNEKISLTVDSVFMDIIQKESMNKYTGKDERTAVISFTRLMVYKKDFYTLQPWIDSEYYQYPETDTSRLIIENYKNYVKTNDDRFNHYYPQPPDVLRDGFEIYLKIPDAMFHEPKIQGVRVLLRLLAKNNTIIRSAFERSPYFDQITKEMNRALNLAIEQNLVEYAELLLEAGFEFIPGIIFRAISNSSAKTVELLLKIGVNPHIHYVSGHTNLIKAVSNGSLKIVELLLKHGVDPNITNSCPTTALIEAVRRDSEECVEMLLIYGANPNLSGLGYNAPSPIILAAQKGSVTIAGLLLKYGADPNVVGLNGDRPLIISTRNGSTKIVELLLKHGAELNITNQMGDSPLKLAINMGKNDILSLLQVHTEKIK